MSMTDEEIDADLDGGSITDKIVLAPPRRDVPADVAILTMRSPLLLPTKRKSSDIGRPKSLAILAAARNHERNRLVGVFTQRDPRAEDPPVEELHPIGCLAYIDEIIIERGRILGAVLVGISRIELGRVIHTHPYVRAGIRECPRTTETVPQFPTVRARTLELVAHLDGFGTPWETLAAIANLDAGTFCDVVGSLLIDNIMTMLEWDETTALLAATDVEARVRVLGTIVERCMRVFENFN